MPEKNLTLKEPPASAPPAAAFDTWESKLAGALGLTRDEVRKLRQQHLVEDLHWVGRKKRILYSAAGVTALHEALALPAPPKNAPAAPGDNAAHSGAAAEPPVTLKVFRAGLKNPHVIEAHRPDKNPADPAHRITVRVKKSANFTVGMEIPVRELRPGLYELARACPRSKGRW